MVRPAHGAHTRGAIIGRGILVTTVDAPGPLDAPGALPLLPGGPLHLVWPCGGQTPGRGLNRSAEGLEQKIRIRPSNETAEVETCQDRLKTPSGMS